MKRILGVGIATLDIINRVEVYPPEDGEVRALDQRLSRGGNCTNTLVVLSQLGYACDWAGHLADDDASAWVRADLEQRGIRWLGSEPIANGRLPTSYVTLSERTGSRTIVHYRDLPEYGGDCFAGLDLSAYDWVHFEGRNVPDLARMMARVRDVLPQAGVSLEIEKPREGLVDLASMADVVLFSRGFAQSKGYAEPASFLKAMAQSFPGQALYCAWGERGAGASEAIGGYCWCDAVPPASIVDTLGAGDVFNAAVIDARLRGEELRTGLHHACDLAARKCARLGLDDLLN